MENFVTPYRNAVLASLREVMPTVDWVTRYWGSYDQDACPLGYVRIPQILTDRHDNEDVLRSVTFHVVIKRNGGDDIDDVMEADAAYVEVAVLRILEELGLNSDLTETHSAVDGAGNRPVGELALFFQADVVTPRGDPSRPIHDTY